MSQKHTQIHLPLDLAALAPNLLIKSQKETLALIITRAQAGEYHSTKSKLSNPKIFLISQLALLAPHTNAIISEIRCGIYNEIT